MVDREEIIRKYRNLIYGTKEAMYRDIGESAAMVDAAIQGYLNSTDSLLERVGMWIDIVNPQVKPSVRENRDAAIARNILLERLVECPAQYVLLHTLIQVLRTEYAIHIAMCPTRRLQAIIVTNYPTDEYAAGLAVTGYRLTQKEG